MGLRIADIAADTLLLDDELVIPGKAELTEYEREIGGPLPPFFREFLLQYGYGTWSGLFDIMEPEYRRRLTDYGRELWADHGHLWWPRSEAVMPRTEALEASVLINTMDGDLIAWHPATRTFFVTPRHDNIVTVLDHRMSALAEWAQFDPPYWFEPIGNRGTMELSGQPIPLEEYERLVRATLAPVTGVVHSEANNGARYHKIPEGRSRLQASVRGEYENQIGEPLVVTNVRLDFNARHRAAVALFLAELARHGFSGREAVDGEWVPAVLVPE